MADQLIGPDSTYVRLAARGLARELIWWATCRHRQGPQRNICLFATRRGGSTWAMEMIAANRGIRPMNQPFETLSRNLTLAQAFEIPRFPQGQITSLGEPEAAMLGSYVRRMFSGELVVNAPLRFWQTGFERVSNRVVLKITDAKAVIGWFDENVDADIVYLTRHPVSQSLSCIRNGWTLTTRSYLADPHFCAAFLGAAEGRCRDLMDHGSPLEQWALNWAVENVAPMTLLPERPEWLHLRYEDAVLHAERELARLAGRLGLQDMDRMEQVLRRPSGSSRRSLGGTRDAIKKGDRAGAVDGWRAKVGAEDLSRTAAVLELVGIDPKAVVERW